MFICKASKNDNVLRVLPLYVDAKASLESTVKIIAKATEKPLKPREFIHMLYRVKWKNLPILKIPIFFVISTFTLLKLFLILV